MKLYCCSSYHSNLSLQKSVTAVIYRVEISNSNPVGHTRYGECVRKPSTAKKSKVSTTL